MNHQFRHCGADSSQYRALDWQKMKHLGRDLLLLDELSSCAREHSRKRQHDFPMSTVGKSENDQHEQVILEITKDGREKSVQRTKVRASWSR